MRDLRQPRLGFCVGRTMRASITEGEGGGQTQFLLASAGDAPFAKMETPALTRVRSGVSTGWCCGPESANGGLAGGQISLAGFLQVAGRNLRELLRQHFSLIAIAMFV